MEPGGVTDIVISFMQSLFFSCEMEYKTKGGLKAKKKTTFLSVHDTTRKSPTQAGIFVLMLGIFLPLRPNIGNITDKIKY